MSKNEFRLLMISLLETQIDGIRESSDYESSEYRQGQEAGVAIAIEKLKLAAFITEKGE